MHNTQDWPTIGRDDIQYQTPFRADGRYYVSQTTIPRSTNWFVLSAAILFAIIPLIISIEGPSYLNLIWYGVITVVIFISVRDLLFDQRLKRFRHFEPHKLYAPKTVFHCGEPLACGYRLLPLGRSLLGESVIVNARIVCQECVEIQRGTETEVETQLHWSIALPPQRFSATDTDIRYTIKEMLPKDLPLTFDAAKHWVHWYVQVRLKFTKTPPFFVSFQIPVM